MKDNEIWKSNDQTSRSRQSSDSGSTFSSMIFAPGVWNYLRINEFIHYKTKSRNLMALLNIQLSLDLRGSDYSIYNVYSNDTALYNLFKTIGKQEMNLSGAYWDCIKMHWIDLIHCVPKNIVNKLNKNRNLNKSMDIWLAKTNIWKQVSRLMLITILSLGGT